MDLTLLKQTIKIGRSGQGGQAEKGMEAYKSPEDKNTFVPPVASMRIAKISTKTSSAQNSPRSSPRESPDASLQYSSIKDKMLRILSERPGYDAEHCKNFVDELIEILLPLALPERKEKVKTLLINLKV